MIALETESPAYQAARQELLDAELKLREQRIRVAALRRALPAGAPVEDYVFDEGPRDLARDAPVTPVRLSELFKRQDSALILYHFMYGAAQEKPCPSCSMWVDGWNATLRHIDRRTNLAIVAQAPIGDMRAWARQRGWTGLRFLSSAGSTFKTDFGSQADDGSQVPVITVFTKDADGSPRHFYTGGARLADGIWGGVDQLSPVWNLFDLTPEGRGDWYPSLEYD
jgi:predicted dithiol-disulfide oxidoreductase (DUF899 family)